MKCDEKSSPLALLKILMEETDEDTCLTTKELLEILREQYGIEMHRVTLKRDLLLLQEMGFGVLETRRRENEYCYVDRDFDTAELKLLVDAVASSHLISERATDELIGKLTKQAARSKAPELTRNIVYLGKPSTRNVFYVVDAINEAINRQRMISYQMCDYGVSGERVLRNGGEVYLFSPYSLVWDNDNYYMVGFSDKYKSESNVRVDRIWAPPKILDTPAAPMPAGFRIESYLKEHYHMQTAGLELVTLQCSYDVIGAIIDRFGADVTIRPKDKTTFWVREQVSVGNVFFSWVFGFGGKVLIHGPEKVKKKYREMLERAVDAE